jgi:hypothetical protein
MAIKFEINMTNRWLYSLIVVGILLALGVGVYAYQSNMRTGNPSVMGHSAGEIHVEVGGEIKTLQEAIDEGGFMGSDVKWTPVQISLGSLRYAAGTSTYNIPKDIPVSAKEILIYVWVRKGRGGGDARRVYKIYTSDGSRDYVKKLDCYQYDQHSWTYNSDNQWFPLTSKRKIYVNLNGDVTGNKVSGIEIIGYR